MEAASESAIGMAADTGSGTQVPDVDFLRDDEHRSGDLRCPHCRSLTYRRTSRELTATFRELYYMCRNPACGHTFKASLSYDYGLSPSAIPDPDLDLPLRPMERIPGYNARAPDDPVRDDPNQPRLFD